MGVIMKSNAGSVHIPIIGKRLFNKALEWAGGPPYPRPNHGFTVKQLEERIKRCKGRKQVINGSRSIVAARKAVMEAIEAIEVARVMRVKGGYRPLKRRVWQLPKGKPEDRLQDFVAAAVKPLTRHYRMELPAQVYITRDPAAVGVTQERVKDWHYYAKSCKYPKIHVLSTITVPAGWRVRVLRRDLAMVDGLLTLDAAPLAAKGAELFAARWLEQSRGYTLVVQDGYIARQGVVAYHGKTAKSALAGLARKLKLAEDDQIFKALLTPEKITRLVKRHPDLVVSVRDARNAGACEYGIRSWCYRVGLDYDAGETTLAKVVAAFEQEPNPWARAAMVVALRRQRKRVMGDS